MSIVLLKQYRDTDDQIETNENLQKEFTDSGINSVVVPNGLSVEMITNLGQFGIGESVAVINTFGITKKILADAAQLKKELEENDIRAIILPYNTGIEILIK